MPCFMILLCLFLFSVAWCEEQVVVESFGVSTLTIRGGNNEKGIPLRFFQSWESAVKSFENIQKGIAMIDNPFWNGGA